MPSSQDCAERLREQAYRTLLPQIRDLEQELKTLGNSVSSGVRLLEQKLETLSHIELPTTELVLTEILADVVRRKELETSALAQFARSLKTKDTQEGILALLLDAAQEYFPRTAIFAVRGDKYIGWSSRGYSEGLSRTIGSCTFARPDSPVFEDALASENLVSADLSQDQSVSFLTEEAQGPYCLIPLHVLGRPVALLVAGATEEQAGDKDALWLTAEFAVQRLENVALKVLYQLTASKPETEPPPQQAEAPARRLARPEPPATAEVRYAAAQSAAEVVPSSASDPKFDLDTVRPPAPQPETAFPAVAAEAAPVADSYYEEEAVAQPPVLPPQIPSAQPQEVRPLPEEEKLHSEAKRFARLLVSEIKLYNEHHVVEGRQNRDLYLRLKRDIDRSREMYEKRVSPNVARKIDYFHDEIIRILGDNDPSTLGSDYPGPRVES